MVTNHGLIADGLKMYERKYIFQTEEALHQTLYTVFLTNVDNGHTSRITSWVFRQWALLTSHGSFEFMLS